MITDIKWLKREIAECDREISAYRTGIANERYNVWKSSDAYQKALARGYVRRYRRDLKAWQRRRESLKRDLETLRQHARMMLNLA